MDAEAQGRVGNPSVGQFRPGERLLQQSRMVDYQHGDAVETDWADVAIGCVAEYLSAILGFDCRAFLYPSKYQDGISTPFKGADCRDVAGLRAPTRRWNSVSSRSSPAKLY